MIKFKQIFNTNAFCVFLVFSEEDEEANGLDRRDPDSSVDDVYYLGPDGLGSNPGWCDRCCAQSYPSGFSRELKAMFSIGWPIVSK